MKGAGCRNKGSAFELSVAKVLGNWWGVDLRRTPLSGGWSGANTCGDIVPVPPDKDDPQRSKKMSAMRKWPFSVECKAQEGWTVDQLLTSPEKSPLASFLRQCFQGAARDRSRDALPLLVAKRNRMPPLLFIECGLDLRETGAIGWLPFLDKDGQKKWVWVYRLEDFVALSPNWVLKNICRR